MRKVVRLQTATVFWLSGRTISHISSMYTGLEMLGRPTYSRTTSASDFEMATEKLKSHKFPGIDEIPAEFIKAEVRTIRSEVHQLINYIWVKEELHEEWKESVILPIYKKGEKTDCGNYRSISLLSTTYNILSNILLSRLTQYAEKTIGDHQCGFRHNRLTTDHIFCVHQIHVKKWVYNDAAHRLFLDCKKA